MLNLHSIFRQVITAVENNQHLQKYVNIETLRNDLIIRIEDQINNILINIADCYPQAQASGGTPRMREVISDVNRSDAQENDFFYTSGFR